MPIPEAARRLCRRTPLIFAPPLGCWLKLESLQATGSFKLRGAAVKLARLDKGARVVAASAGNHGLGVALAARALNLSATVVVPHSSARVKRAGMTALGAEVILEGHEYDDAERFARTLAAQRGDVFVSPFDDEDVIDGNGRWLADELREDRAQLTRVIVPLGGGGLIGGLAEVLAPLGVQVIGVQPRANCAMQESFAAGRAQTTYVGGATVCEGLAGAVSERTYALARAHVDELALVDEEEVLGAMAFAYRALGLVVEPSAAVGLAAVRAQRVAVDENSVVVVTGSNVDPEVLDRALQLGAL
jgi:threonine dehydratase